MHIAWYTNDTTRLIPARLGRPRDEILALAQLTRMLDCWQQSRILWKLNVTIAGRCSGSDEFRVDSSFF